MIHWAHAFRVAARPSLDLSLPHAANTQVPFYTATARKQCVPEFQCPSWVIRVISSVRQPLPVYPEEQTFSVSLGMSQKCRKRTSAGGFEMPFPRGFKKRKGYRRNRPNRFSLVLDNLKAKFIRRTLRDHCAREAQMARLFVDCRDYPSEMNCTVAISADTKEELVDAAVQHAVAVHGHQDCPQLREELAKMVKAQ
jgi:predicted small metal-binding protein